MGACCGGTVPPENKPNVDNAPKFVTSTHCDSMRASTNVFNNDPEIQALLQQNRARQTVEGSLDSLDDPDNPSDPFPAAFRTTEEAIITGDISITPKKSRGHKAIPSQSLESMVTVTGITADDDDQSLMTPTKTRIIHHSRATNGSLVVLDSATSMTSTDPSESGNISEESALNKPQTIYTSPTAKSQIENMSRPLTRDDVQKWGETLTNLITENQLQYTMDSCPYSLDNCPCVHRLVFMLKIYNQCNDPNDGDFLIDNIAGYIQPFEDYQCLNDYYHFIHHHTATPVPFSAFDTQCTSRMASPRDLNLDAHSNGDSNIYSFDRITDFFVEHCFGTKHCDERNCLCFKRNHRDRSKALSNGYYGGDHGDYSLIALQQILDSIHCGIFHRITNEEDSERIMEIMKRRHPTLYTIDTGICIKSDDQHSMEMEHKMREWDREYDAEQNERQNASSIHAMSTQISSILKESAVNAVDTDSKTVGPLPLKSQVVSKLTSPPIPRQPHCSFGNLADAADKERDFSDAPNYIISEKEYLALPYTFGPHMFYHYDDALKHPTYSDLKKELLLNTTSPMTPYQWSITEAKARIIHKTYPIHRGTNDDDDEMSINQIIAVLVYCNFDSLRRALQSSFSDKELHKKYSHWGHALFSMIKSYGTTDQQLADEFEAVYCALNFPFKFYSFNHFNFNGLFSATPHLSIVTAGDISADGIILKLNSSHFGVAPFVEVSTVFSDFKDERHHLFGFSNGCVLQIDEVFTTFDLRNDTPSKTHRNKAFIAALQVFEQMVIDMPYIEDHTQYQWLQRSLDRAEGTEQGQGNGAGFSVMEILEFMITDCLSADDGTHGVDENPKLKSIKTPMTKLFALDNGDDVEHKEIERNNTECPVIPSFIETQLGFFRHCLRETEYCRLCCDLKKMELLPQSIRSKLLVDANGLNGNRDIGHIAFGNWCRLFPNDRVIAIKNMDSEQYESVIDAFVRFVSDQGVSEAVACLQCIDIDTDSKEHCDEIEDLVNGKNASDLKKVNWTLVYELVRRRIGSDEKDSYSILMKKDVVIPNEDEKEHNVQVNENLMVEYVSPLALEERKTLDIEGVDELCANIMSAVEEQKKREETPMSSGFGTDNDPFAGRWGMSGFGTDNDLDTDGGATPVDGFVTPRSLNEHESNSQPAELVH